ncbi:MAG: hypothetical protein ABIK23_02725 [candidate division WOR-3 bacterium]
MTERKFRMNGLICLPFCLYKTEDRRPTDGKITRFYNQTAGKMVMKAETGIALRVAFKRVLWGVQDRTQEIASDRVCEANLQMD